MSIDIPQHAEAVSPDLGLTFISQFIILCLATLLSIREYTLWWHHLQDPALNQDSMRLLPSTIKISVEILRKRI